MLKVLGVLVLVLGGCVDGSPEDPEGDPPGTNLPDYVEVTDRASGEETPDAPPVPVCWATKHGSCPNDPTVVYEVCVPYNGCGCFTCITDLDTGAGENFCYCGPGM